MSEMKNMSGQRGPAEHVMRERIVALAHTMFRNEGFAETSVAKIAAELDVAPTYLYKFFQSKDAIGSAVCGRALEEITDAIWAVARSETSASQRIRDLFRVILKESVGMFFADRKLLNLVARSIAQDWPSIAAHKEKIKEVVQYIIRDGMKSGEFDPDIDFEEVVEAVFWALRPYAEPRILEQSMDIDLENQSQLIARFCLRALTIRKTI